MFEAIIAMCLAGDVTGEEVNPCYMRKHEYAFRNYEACRKWGNEYELDFVAKSTNEVSVVIHVACGAAE